MIIVGSNSKEGKKSTNFDTESPPYYLDTSAVDKRKSYTQVQGKKRRSSFGTAHSRYMGTSAMETKEGTLLALTAHLPSLMYSVTAWAGTEQVIWR